MIPVEYPTEQCQHYWKIESAHGPTSTGFCQRCGEIKNFVNYVAPREWGDKPSSKTAKDDN